MRAHAHERVLHSSIFPIKALDVRKRAYNIRNSPGALYTSNNSLHKESHVSETEKQCVMGHMRLLVDVLKKPWMSAKEPVLTAIALELSKCPKQRPTFLSKSLSQSLTSLEQSTKTNTSLPHSHMCPKQSTVSAKESVVSETGHKNGHPLLVISTCFAFHMQVFVAVISSP